MSTELINRIKSFTWRLSMMTLVFVVEAIAQNIGMVGLPMEVTLMVGLIAGEISKYLNNKYF